MRESMGICFFIGRHNAQAEVFPLLAEAVERHITEYNVTDFYVGHYGAFDAMAARAVIAAKKRRPFVTLALLLPYHPHDCPVELPQGFDGTYYPPGMEHIPRRYAIARANRSMICDSRYLIAYARPHLGSSGALLEFARRREARGLIRVENLADRMNVSGDRSN